MIHLNIIEYNENRISTFKYNTDINFNRRNHYCIKNFNLSSVIHCMKDRKEEIKDEHMVQRVIDLDTGKDITGEYINQRLKELDKTADMIIDKAFQDFRKDHNKKTEIYEEAYWQIHEKLGMGSIGPATAAAGPLMEKKKQKLAKVLDIRSKDLM